MTWNDRIQEQRALVKELEYAWLKRPDVSMKEFLHEIKVKIGADAKDDAKLLTYLRENRRAGRRILP